MIHLLLQAETVAWQRLAEQGILAVVLAFIAWQIFKLYRQAILDKEALRKEKDEALAALNSAKDEALAKVNAELREIYKDTTAIMQSLQGVITAANKDNASGLSSISGKIDQILIKLEKSRNG